VGSKVAGGFGAAEEVACCWGGGVRGHCVAAGVLVCVRGRRCVRVERGVGEADYAVTRGEGGICAIGVAASRGWWGLCSRGVGAECGDGGQLRCKALGEISL
jgi:hypothetical protein